MFSLQFSMANEAFDEPATEIARILRHVARRVENGELPDGDDTGFGMPVKDINGNTVGQWKVTPD